VILFCPLGAVVTDELARKWRTSLPSVKMATIAGAGHDVERRPRRVPRRRPSLPGRDRLVVLAA
jgi:hypothetical protein